MMRSSAAAIAFLSVTLSVSLGLAEDGAAAEAAVAEATVSTLQSSATEARELAGGYHLGDQVVALVDFESTSGRVSKGELGVAVAKGSAPNSIECNFENYQAFEATFAQIGSASTVLNGGFHIGDKVVALIDWEGASGGITRGDVGMVLDQGRGKEGLVVDFPRLKRLSVLLAQVTKFGVSLNGGYGVGDKVVSLIDWVGKAGNISQGDIGVALGRGNGEKGLIVDFPHIKNLNIMLNQIKRPGTPSTAAQPAAKEEAAAPVSVPEQPASQVAALQGEEAAPQTQAGTEAEASSAAAPASEAKPSESAASPAKPAQEQLAALQDGEAATQTQAGTEAEAGSAAAPASEAKASEGAAPPAQPAQEQLAAVQGGEAASQTKAGTEAEPGSAAAPANEAKDSEGTAPPGQPALPAQEGMEALQTLASSLSQKLAKKKEAAAAAEASQLDSLQQIATSLAKKLEQAKENRVASEKEAMPARRSVLQADAWPMDSASADGAKPSMLQRLMSPLLGKTRNSDAEAEVVSLMQEGAKVAKKPLLAGRKKHEEL